MRRIFFPILAWLAALTALPAQAADAPELEDLIDAHYYEIEFFVFERPAVLDFSTAESLALDGPRALPLSMRSQRLNPEAPWDGPIDPTTRTCLTFPTLTYVLRPMESARNPGEQPPAGEVAQSAIVEPVPVPEIHPHLEPHPQLDFLARLATFERQLADRADQWLPPETFVLSRAAQRVSREARILFHGRWLMDLPPRGSSDLILIEGGEVLPLPARVPELVGTVGASLGRYLHFRVDLFFHAPGLGMEPVSALLDSNGDAQLLSPPIPEGRYMHLAESRRMRSGELHYLDHPKLGVLVRIDPVTLPPELVEAFEALQEGVD